MDMRLANTLLAIVIVLSLAGCGGSGGGGNTGGAHYTVGGSVSGLNGSLLLQNGSENLLLTSNGAFSFLTPVSTYSVAILSAPNDQTCSRSNYSGTATAAVTNVLITCSTATDDPLYSQQWHLNNAMQVGEDINVASVWDQTCGDYTCRGNNVKVVVVDDGLDTTHEDLLSNYNSSFSWNYRNSSTNPSHFDATSGHGTSVAGIIAARDWNGVGGRGVAPRVSLSAINLLENSSDANDASAMTRNASVLAVSSNSWGSPDDTGTTQAPAATWYNAIDIGLATGRSGLGIIYVWAAGNGAPRDNSNQDGQANYRGVIAVAALRDNGTQTSYSERGANLWVSAPGGEFCGVGGGGRTITTTDRTGNAGANNGATVDELAGANYTQCFNGTSAATPMVSGVVTLMLQANPNLNWRDVRLILAETARKNDAINSADGYGWQTGALIPGSASTLYHFHHNYGFGVVDAAAAVARAKTWSNVSAALTPCAVTHSGLSIAIPDNTISGVSDTATISGCAINKIEYVEVKFSSNHTYSSDLTIALQSPAGIISSLAETTACNPAPCNAYNNWTFGSAVHLGEAANGIWTLNVSDRGAADTGNITSWQITLYGRAN